MGDGVGVGGGTKVTHVVATVGVCATGPEDEAVVEPDDIAPATAPEVDVGLGFALGVGLLLLSGAGTALGAAEQVVTIVVTGTGFGVGVMLPIGAAVPPVDKVGPAEGATALDGAWLGLVMGDWLGFVGVVRLGGVMLLWLGVARAGEGVGVC